jgi:neutral ceramidase
VGSAEAGAMLAAWRRAGAHLSGAPPFALRWTRSCFCGRTVLGGQVASSPEMGFPFFTGSEENRGPLYDETHVNHEGEHLPFDNGPQGDKIPGVGPPVADFPSAVPLMAVRLGDRILVTVPGEMTVEMGRRTRAAVMAAAGSASGVKGVAIAGYANEYLHYFTTPEEYEWQAYEGGSTVFGKYSSNLIMGDLAALAGDLVRGAPAPPPVAFDPRNGVVPDTRPYESGADHGDVVAQPAPVQRLGRASFSWRGSPRGLDRPLDSAFLSVERRAGRRWRHVTDDLGLEIVWRVDDAGRYDAQWQIPLSTAAGAYRFVVTANRYRLESAPFSVAPSTALTVRSLGRRGSRVLVELRYPPVDDLNDLTTHPTTASGGRVRARVGRRAVFARSRRGRVFAIRAPAGEQVRIGAGAARDRFGNRNRDTVVVDAA